MRLIFRRLRIMNALPMRMALSIVVIFCTFLLNGAPEPETGERFDTFVGEGYELDYVTYDPEDGHSNLYPDLEKHAEILACRGGVEVVIPEVLQGYYGLCEVTEIGSYRYPLQGGGPGPGYNYGRPVFVWRFPNF